MKPITEQMVNLLNVEEPYSLSTQINSIHLPIQEEQIFNYSDIDIEQNFELNDIHKILDELEMSEIEVNQQMLHTQNILSQENSQSDLQHNCGRTYINSTEYDDISLPDESIHAESTDPNMNSTSLSMEITHTNTNVINNELFSFDSAEIDDILRTYNIASKSEEEIARDNYKQLLKDI